MSNLPERVVGQASDLLARAAAVANSDPMVRFEIVTVLIGTSRSFWRGTDEEIYAAAGYRDANEYWAVAMSEPTEATKFAHLLAIHLLDPTEQLNPFDRRSKVQQIIDAALRLALKARESWFIDATPNSHLNAVVLHPRAAAEWLLSLPKRKNLVPPGLKAFLERPKQALPASDAAPDYSSGVAGRPTSIHLIEAEMRRRATTHELLPVLNDESKYLEDWLKSNYPNAPRATAKTIKNSLRNIYRTLNKDPK